MVPPYGVVEIGLLSGLPYSTSTAGYSVPTRYVVSVTLIGPLPGVVTFVQVIKFEEVIEISI
jgi:uncharacterized membrane protein